MSHKITHIHISNLSEDVWPLIQEMTEEKRTQEIHENSLLAERDLLAAWKPGLIFISPIEIHDGFIRYIEKVLGTNGLRVLVPKKHSGKTSEDALNDEVLLNKLLRLTEAANELHITSQCASPQFYAFVDVITKTKHTKTPEAPRAEAAWTVDYFGSKSGFRKWHEAQREKIPIKMTPGSIHVNLGSAIKEAVRVHESRGGVVLKVSKGHAGEGVLILREKDLPSPARKKLKVLKERIEKDAYWKESPIVVEEYRDINQQIGGGFPNIECIIQEDGNTEFLYSCGMRVTKEGVFKGIEIGPRVLPKKVEQLLKRTGKVLGKEYAKAGYRGYFDVDCLMTTTDELIITESNLRRTGGTHTFQIARLLHGPDFASHTHTLSENLKPLPHKNFSFKKVLSLLDSVLYNHNTKEGLIMSMQAGLKNGYLGYIIIGKTKKSAYRYESQMEKLLSFS